MNWLMGGITKAAASLHLLHERAYTTWKVRSIPVQFRETLTFAERRFFLQLHGVLGGSGLVVYDIGASVGVLVSCMAKVANVREVHAFEPVASSFVQLVKNTGRFPHVKCHNVAIGDESATTTINVHQFAPSSSLLEMSARHEEEFPGTKGHQTQDVSLVRLDDIVRRSHLPLPDVLVIDVQGYEDRVLRGGVTTISAAKYCIVETSFEPLYYGSPVFDDIYGLMRNMSFRLVGIAGSLSGRSRRQVQCDAVFENTRRPDR